MNKKLLDEAVRIALEKLLKHPEYLCYPHYSFLVQDNKILSMGMNNKNQVPLLHYGYHTRVDHTVPKMHAEPVAWRRGRGLLNKMKSWELINIRLNRHYKLMASAPCSSCFNLLKSVGCTTFHYSSELGFVKLST
jgi:hypothetical protein